MRAVLFSHTAVMGIPWARSGLTKLELRKNENELVITLISIIIIVF
jgi:hypothetical protein